MSETLQGVGLFAIAFLGFGTGTLFCGWLINNSEYDDTGLYIGAWITGTIVYAITVVMMWKG